MVSGCQSRRAPGAGRPTSEQIAAVLPKGASVEHLVFADLNGDGREEALVAAMVPTDGGRRATAFVYALEGRRYTPLFERWLPGDTWLPIQLGHPGDGAPLVGVYAVRSGSQGMTRYLVVRHNGRAVVSALEHSGLFQGSLRFVGEGLLESSGDTDRLLRWTEGGWQAEELGGQYMPALPPETTRIEYFVDQARGPMIDMPRTLRPRVGQYIALRRTDRGAPSRVFFTGATSAYSIGPDGIITLVQPGVFQIHIEGPAYSGRVLTFQVQVDP
jgi:hypothetical protein